MTNIILNKEQQEAKDAIVPFYSSKVLEMTLQGPAGTGKTTCLLQIVKVMEKKRIPYMLCSTTNRAAKVMADATDKPAITLDKFLFKTDEYGNKESRYGKFGLKQFSDGIVVIDEASMIGKDNMDELLKQIRTLNCKVLYVGDPEQLPPVQENPRNVFKEADMLGVKLDKVMRQAKDSQILALATAIRRKKYVLLPADSKGDVKYRDNLFVPFVMDQKRGISSALVVAKNDTRVKANLAVRKALNYPENDVVEGETLIGIANSTSIANSENFVLEEILENYGKFDFPFTYRKGKNQITVTVHCDVLKGKVDGATRKLLVMKDFPSASIFPNTGIPNEYRRMLAGKTDKAFASISKSGFVSMEADVIICTYGYAITCNKSQGGQWDNVYVAERWSWGEAEHQYRWFYTAVTRAAKKLFLSKEMFAQKLDWANIEAICDGGVPVSSQVQTSAEDYAMPEYEECFGSDEVPPPTDADFNNVTVVDCI